MRWSIKEFASDTIHLTEWWIESNEFTLLKQKAYCYFFLYFKKGKITNYSLDFISFGDFGKV
jgi:hypothetical protein